MNPERWNKIEDIFQAALDLSGEEREEFIQAESGDDEDLCAEVKNLVVRFEEDESFLESPVWTDSQFLGNTLKKRVAVSLDEESPVSASENSLINRKIGVYLLTEQIGRGGMGEVYSAERADGEFSQKVAIKLIKRGMDTDFIIGRFRHERQILAALNHPNIARLLDGGTTLDGSPYFVMEFIEGEPFFKFCETNNLDLRERLKLFLAVCNAISYAHNKKIIHRDIKPGNVLISAEGVPKLLDFGIAKILDPELIQESIAPTATQMRLMTPEYASPEQARGDEITPASDQYSLGVLLYEIVTGARPYKFPSRAPHEIARVICEEIPTDPSAAENKISTGGARLEPNDDFSRNLDRIILKTLRKNLAERYATVKEFAGDIERLLDNKQVRAESFTSENEPGGTNPKSIKTKHKQKSIAVLPLQILNTIDDDAGDGQFLSIGLADALITRLSNVRQLIVRPTSSILRFSEKNIDSFKIGRELNVEYILSGSLLRAGARIRVSVQLLEVSNQATVSAERFDMDFKDFLSLEDEVSARVVESLVPQLTTGERRELAKRGTENSDAYEAYLRGRFHWNTFTEDGLRQAIHFYRKAIEIDPGYALAYAGIADYFIWLGIFGTLSPSKSYQPSKQMAQRAISIDTNFAEAHAALGFAQLCGDYNWKESEKNIRRAISINPNYAVAYNWLAIYLFTAGRFDEGIEYAKKAIELDPLTYQNYRTLSWGYYFSRRFDEALVEVDRSIKKFPLTGTAHANRSWLLRSMGKAQEALLSSERAMKTTNSNFFVVLGHAQSLAAAGKFEEAEKIVRDIESQAAERYVSYYQIALVYCYAREKEKALDALERAFADREGWLVWLDVEPALDFLRNDSRFVKIVKKVNPDSAVMANPEPDSPEVSETKQKSIAVLPFTILNDSHIDDSGDKAFLKIGLADALITRLSNIQQFIVRPTSSVLSFSSGDDDPIVAGRELKVNFVLVGNIFYTGSRVRVSVHLLDTATQSTVWAERFDETLADVLTLEDIISKKVVESLVPQLTTGEIKDLAKRGTDNSEAYEAYLRGRSHWNTFTREGFRQAIFYYKKAVQLDSGYALAYAAIADYYNWLGMYGALPVGEFCAPAKEAAERAIALDSKLSEAYSALGLAELYGEYNWQASERNMRRAIELNPNNSVAYNWFYHNLITQGKIEEGVACVKRAVELDPSSFQNYNTLAWGFYFARQFDEALAQAEKLIEKFPVLAFSYFGKSCYLSITGRSEEALQVAETAAELSDDSMFTVFGRAQALAAAGRRTEAEALIEESGQPASRQRITNYHTALVYCYLIKQDKDKAFEFLERSFAEHEAMLIWLGVEPSFDVLREDARFQSLLARIKYPLAQNTNVLPASGKTKPAGLESKTSRRPQLPQEKYPQEKPSKEKLSKEPPPNLSLRYALIISGLIIAAVILYFAIIHFA